MKSPFTGVEMKLIKEKEILPYRKDEFEVCYLTFECEQTKERFTTDALDLININQVHNLYREKYGIPFPEEIKAIREKYEVSAKKMSEILGLGSNAYRLYESGEMPSVSIGRLILSIKEPKEFRRQIGFSSHLLKDNESVKLLRIVEKLIEDTRDELKRIQNAQYFYSTINVNSGFKLLDFDKIGNVLSFFNSKNLGLFKTKVNKLLFYTDFLTYQRSGSSMLGITYRAIPFGPVPAEYETIYTKLISDNVIEIENVPIGNDFAQKFNSIIPFDVTLFNELELGVLEEVASRFYGKKTNEIVDISHEEKAWQENKDERKIIDYSSYAFELYAFQK